MTAHRRQDQILQCVQDRGAVTVSELAALLETPESAIRRDLSELDAQSGLMKVPGGATSLGNEHLLHDLTIDERANMHAEEKGSIAEYAATLVGPEYCVYIDTGTAARKLVDAPTEPYAPLHQRFLHQRACPDQHGMRAVLVGGELKGATEALVGSEAIETIRSHHFTIGFFGANGITAEQGMTTPDRSEGIRVNAILPGGFSTEIASSMGMPNTDGYTRIDPVLKTAPALGGVKDIANATPLPRLE